MINYSKLTLGLRILNPNGGINHFDPLDGWPIETPSMTQHGLDIYLDDDMLAIDGKIREIEKYIQHYGDDVYKIRFYTWSKNIKDLYPDLNWIYYPLFAIVHAFNAEQNRNLLCGSFDFETKTKKFLCLNRNKRRHRDVVCGKIMHSYQQNSTWSYHARGRSSPDLEDWSKHTYDNESAWGDIDLTDIYNTEANRVLIRNWANVLRGARLYNTTSFSVVTETRNNLPYDFVTEKTYQCFITLHPALYVSNMDHVRCIRDWGFDVFDDVFDHGYDCIGDNDLRIEKLFHDNHSVLRNGLDITPNIKERLLKNRQHYLDNFRQILLDTK